ncbi:MAG: hypothetical protein JWM43_1126 [Acidobacteriaceae bacterium]|nr:hypothetical protein [Acidobacteriaceae bacterium]
MDADKIAQSLGSLTAGWKASSTISPESLDAARKALAGSLVRGKDVGEIHPELANLPLPGADEESTAALKKMLADAPELADPSVLGVVRSAASVDPNNPSGLPAWARGMAIQQTLGPFLDLQGAAHFVDLIPILPAATISSVAFGTAASVFGLFPVKTSVVGPQNVLVLGTGSVWFASHLLVSSLPATAFSGFRIVGGTLTASAPFVVQGGVRVLPANATVTLVATLDPPAVPAGGSTIGQDAQADTVHLPKTVTLTFTQSKATVSALDSSDVKVYGTTVTFTRKTDAPVAFNNNTALLIPCNCSAINFQFDSVLSNEFMPSGEAVVVGAGWVLPIAITSIAALGQAAGAGSLLIGLGAGASAKWTLHPEAVPILGWQIFLDPTQILVLAGGVGPDAVLTTYTLWPEEVPSKQSSTIDFFTPAGFIVTYTCMPGTETLIGTGLAIAHLDRPLAADAGRYGLQAPASLLLSVTSTGTQVTIFAKQPQPSTKLQPLALENALLGVSPPSGLLLSGEVNGTSFTHVGVAMYFNMAWLLPTLPDPYAATFGLEIARPQQGQASILTAISLWDGMNAPAMSFAMGPAPQAATSTTAVSASTIQPASGNTFLSAVQPELFNARASIAATSMPALLDLSTKADLFGVAVVPNSARTGVASSTRSSAFAAGSTFQQNLASAATLTAGPASTTAPGSAATPAPAPAPPAPAPALGFKGLNLALNGATCATFALPQVSWEPMESTAPNFPIYCSPASDGPPLLLLAPDQQQLVPLAPDPVLKNNIGNVAAGQPLFGQFSLPFGLIAHIQQPNRPPNPNGPAGAKSLFLSQGGEFQTNMPAFASALEGALQVTLKPPFPEKLNAIFSGSTSIDSTGGTPGSSGYGYNVLGASPSITATIFQGEFSAGGKSPGVPLRRIDLAGYGASIFSDWSDDLTPTPRVSKVDFTTIIGRTAHEVVQVVTMLYPYCVNVVRTITMERQGAGWVQRTDSGWRAQSDGLFVFPNATDFANRVHRGAVAGVFNVRNIRDLQDYVFVPPGTSAPPSKFQYQKVLFDADIGLDQRVTVLQGGAPSPLKDAVGNPVSLVPARDLVGYLQALPVGTPPTAPDLLELFKQTGPITAAFACVAQVGSKGALAGTTLRCSAIEVDMATTSSAGRPVPAVGAALRSAPALPRDGAWGFGQRRPIDPSPRALAHDFPVPLVQAATEAGVWHIADIADVVRLDNPLTLYGILQDTGTQKLLFEQPTIPILGAFSPPGATPGISLPNPPNFADVASLLNATGLFPDIASTIALLGGAAERLENAADGLKYSKTITLDPTKPILTMLDLGVIQVALSYCDESKGRDGVTKKANAPTQLTYTLDPAAAKRWSFSITNLSFLVYVPEFSKSDALLTVVGDMVADDQTTPTLSNLNLVYGSALSSLKSIFSKLQALAQFLPGGAGAGLEVSLADGKLTVTDTFSLPTLPLGLGQLTDIGIEVGFSMTLSPLKADFVIGVGSPDHPFNWIVSPLAGNGLIDIGVKDGKPNLVVQGGIGLGLAIDVGIAQGSASITLAARLEIAPPSLTVMFILTGQASVDVLGGLASASLTLTAAVGVSVNPLPIPIPLLPPGPVGVEFPAEDITFLASVSVGIHISICWVVNVNFDGSWQFSQSIHTPELRIAA